MDILSDVTYRGLVLTGAAGGPGGNNPVQGFRLTRASYSDVSVHGYTEKKSLEDGFDASDVFLGMRRVVLQGEVFSRSLAAMFDLLDTLRLIFTPTDAYNQDPRERGYLPLYFQQPTTLTVDWTTGVILRELRCRPSAQPEFDIQMNAINGDLNNGGFVMPWVVRLEARDPRFYGIDDIEYMFSGAGTTGHVRNRGNYPAPVNFVLGANTTGIKTFTFKGMATDMVVTIPDGVGSRTVVVDGLNKVVTLHIGETETLRMDLIKFNSGTTWPKAPPTPQGSEDIDFDWTWATGGLVAGSRLFFREAWA